jgi:hypothetical protein
MDKRVVPFKSWHYSWMARSYVKGNVLPNLDRTSLEAMERARSYTGVVDGEAIVSAGVMPCWRNRHIAWAFMTYNTGPHMLWITNEVKKFLATVSGRIELTVRKDFDAGHRWAKMLGFDVETQLLKEYGPLGEDHVGYVRFN